MKKVLKKLTSLWSYIAIIIVMIVALSYGTYSWLERNNKVEETGVPFTLDDSRGVTLKGYEIYKRDGKTGAQCVTQQGRINMTEYDTIFTDRNVDTPIIIRVALYPAPVNQDVKWTIKCKDISKSWTDTGTKDGKFEKYYSNISAVTIGKGNAELDKLYDPTDPSINAEGIYSGAVEILDELEPSSFALDEIYTKEVEGKIITTYDHVSKVEEISDVISVTSSDVAEDGTLVLYIEFKYNSDLVMSYLEDHDDQLDLTIDFPNDLGFIKFDYVNKY